MPEIATLQLPEYYSRYPNQSSEHFKLRPKEIKQSFGDWGIINDAVGKEYCAFKCYGAFADTAVYYGIVNLEQVRSTLLEKLPLFIKKNSFYSSWPMKGEQKEDYGPQLTMYKDWSCISYLYDIEFGDGDGAACITTVYMKKQGDLSAIMVFDGSRTEEEMYTKECLYIVDSFHFLNQ